MENGTYLKELALRLLGNWSVLILLTLKNDHFIIFNKQKTLSNRECFLFNLKFES